MLQNGKAPIWMKNHWDVFLSVYLYIVMWLKSNTFFFKGSVIDLILNYTPTKDVFGLFWTHADNETNIIYYIMLINSVYLFKNIYLPPTRVQSNILDVLGSTVDKMTHSSLHAL